MKLSHWIVAGVMAGLSNSYTALAEDEASFTFHLPVLNYTSTSTSSKVSGVKTTSTTSASDTASRADSYVEASWGKANLYFYPFVDSKKVSASYFVHESVELGLDLGLNTSSVNKPKTTSSNYAYGIWGIYYANLSKSLVLENGLSVGASDSKSKETTTVSGVSTEKKTNVSDLAVKLTVNAVIPLAKNVNYLGGIWYNLDKNNDKEGKVKTDTGTFGVNVATIRLVLK